MSTAAMSVYAWQDLPWRKIERQVFKLQKRIYRASQAGNRKLVHKLQRLLMASYSARTLAVRKVTQDNRGKKTAGVDGIKSLTPPQRMQLVSSIKPIQAAAPVRRVWIAKQGSTEQRPLGIPTLRNRAEQSLVKLALEPEWEAHFEPNSYGFRPGRSCHDAIAAIFCAITKTPKYILDTDIAKCFDRIDQKALVNKLHTFPSLRRIIGAWLQAGVMDGPQLYPTHEGVPQGGPLSPLLTNVALHGLEQALQTLNPKRPPTLIRYADDLVVLHPDLAVVEACQQQLQISLREIGLELKPSKTRITHTLKPHDGPIGFSFLGFHIRQHRVGKTHSGRTGQGKLLGFKTIIRPSKEAIKQQTTKLHDMIKHHRTSPQATLVAALNPIIRGWSNYYATVVAKATFSHLDAILYSQLRRWAARRHPQKSSYWVMRHYWNTEQGAWTFAPKDGTALRGHHKTHIRRHIKVQGTRSPYDGDWVYWASRHGRNPMLPRWIAHLLKQQQGKCAWCGLYLRSEDLAELDHRKPLAQGGLRRRGNLQLIHAHCHDQKTARDKTEAGEVHMTNAS